MKMQSCLLIATLLVGFAIDTSYAKDSWSIAIANGGRETINKITLNLGSYDPADRCSGSAESGALNPGETWSYNASYLCEPEKLTIEGVNHKTGNLEFGENDILTAEQNAEGAWLLIKGVRIQITNKTDKRIMAMVMYPNDRGADKKDVWPLVPAKELDDLIKKANANKVFLEIKKGQQIPAISLQDFNSKAYSGRGDLRSLADSMKFYDQFGKNYFIGIVIFDKDKGRIAEVYSHQLKASDGFVANFTEKDGTYYFNDTPALTDINLLYQSHWMQVTNKTDKRIMVMAMYPSARGADKKDWWPLVPTQELADLVKNTKAFIGKDDKKIPAISLQDFNSKAYNGRGDLRSLADKMAFYDQFGKNYFVGIAIFDKNKGQVAEVYSLRTLGAQDSFSANFKEKDGLYYFNDIPAIPNLDKPDRSHWMQIINKTSKPIAISAMYCEKRGQDKKYAWLLVPLPINSKSRADQAKADKTFMKDKDGKFIDKNGKTTEKDDEKMPAITRHRVLARNIIH